MHTPELNMKHPTQEQKGVGSVLANEVSGHRVAIRVHIDVIDPPERGGKVNGHVIGTWSDGGMCVRP